MLIEHPQHRLEKRRSPAIVVVKHRDQIALRQPESPIPIAQLPERRLVDHMPHAGRSCDSCHLVVLPVLRNDDLVWGQALRLDGSEALREVSRPTVGRNHNTVAVMACAGPGVMA